MSDIDYKFIIYVILGLATIIAMVIIYVKQRNKKNFTYEFLSIFPLYTVNRQAKERLRILFDDKPAANPYLLIIFFKNAGNVPILAEDILEPISITFGEHSRVLSAEIISTSPDNMGAILDIKNNIISLRPVLINQKESLSIRIIFEDEGEIVKISGRLKGISRIIEAKEPLFIKYICLGGLSLIPFGILLKIIGLPLIYARSLAIGGALLILLTMGWSIGTNIGKKETFQRSTNESIRIEKWLKAHGLK